MTQGLVIGYSLNDTRVCSLNSFQLIMGLYGGPLLSFS